MFITKKIKELSLKTKLSEMRLLILQELCELLNVVIIRPLIKLITHGRSISRSRKKPYPERIPRH